MKLYKRQSILFILKINSHIMDGINYMYMKFSLILNIALETGFMYTTVFSPTNTKSSYQGLNPGPPAWAAGCINSKSPTLNILIIV